MHTTCGRVAKSRAAGPCRYCGGPIKHSKYLAAEIKTSVSMKADHTSRDGDNEFQRTYIIDDLARNGPEHVTLIGRIVKAITSRQHGPKYMHKGDPRQGESGVLEVCQILVDHLNREGAAWLNPVDLNQEPGHRENGVDCRASSADSSAPLDMQVTRAAGDAILRQLAKHGVITERDPAHTIRTILQLLR